MKKLIVIGVFLACCFSNSAIASDSSQLACSTEKNVPITENANCLQENLMLQSPFLQREINGR